MKPNIPKIIKLNYLVKDHLFLNTKPGKSIQENSLGFIDIGARVGIHDVLAPIACKTTVIAFEPYQTAYLDLKKDQTKSSQWSELEIGPLALNNKISK